MRVATELFGVTFQNPVLLASGTCGFGRELADVLDLEALGGFVTKSLTMEPRRGNPAPRVAEFAGGMINSVGLANPGVHAAKRDALPWIARNVRRPVVFVSLAGHTAGEFFGLVEELDGEDGFLGFELNLSCPNDARRGGPPFALDADALSEVVSGCRARTERPLLAKLAPNDPAPGASAKAAADAGADGLTIGNTLPGLLLDATEGTPEIGAGEGGVSGPVLLPVGLRAVRAARAAGDVPIVGSGGVLTPEDVVAYARAGASLVQLGTASFADPRAAERLVAGLERWGRRHGETSWQGLVAPAGGGPPQTGERRGTGVPAPAAEAPRPARATEPEHVPWRA